MEKTHKWLGFGPSSKSTNQETSWDFLHIMPIIMDYHIAYSQPIKGFHGELEKDT